MKSSASLLLFQRLTIAQPALCTLGRSMEMNLAVPANHFSYQEGKTTFQNMSGTTTS